ncbi:SpoIIE family protein phosphatase [Streptomyces sp. WMMB303]|uniref:SpoIIE family protein phosphatase n=1 Tax=Streptomyces sp. WMMB303 TaxID=3034154 RepID=UPI0023ED23B1|nr:SpoIIE family protein phosphatase [Streptomyces sp. WMMB303]MDF4252588.1 SpoIIE family protein phosphatase [Streptomyces sp. WMMB303]
MSGGESGAVPTAQVRIDHHSAVHLAADVARRTARRCGLDGSLPDQAAAVASELASNLDKHAGDGVVYLQPLPLGEGFEVLAVDRGPGMGELQRCLADGYTTTNTLGTGLGAVSRLADAFVIRTRVPDGTVASARLTPRGGGSPAGGSAEPSGPDGLPGHRAGAICLPAEGEEHCGDGWSLHATAGQVTAAVVDGLGHGEAAARATRVALRIAREAPESALPELMTQMHRALRHTRGAAVGLVRLEPGRLHFCGVGNVRVCVLHHDRTPRRMESRPGIVGWNLPTPHVRTEPLAPDRMAVVHTDGIQARWAHDPSRFLSGLPAPLLPAALAHRHRRHRDDATALALTGLR